MISDEIERLIQLRNSGALSEEEFQRAKSRVLGGKPQPVFTQPTDSAGGPSGLILGLVRDSGVLSCTHPSCSPGPELESSPLW